MSPEEKRENLVQMIRSELERIGDVVAKLAEFAKGLVPDCADGIRMGVAGYLHSFYTGCELVIVRLLEATTGAPAGKDWHQVVLTHAAAGIAGARPPIICLDTATELTEPMKFRHFFRHAYGVTFDVGKLAEHVASVPRAFDLFRRDIDAFVTALERASPPA